MMALYWFATLIASVFIAALFTVGYLDTKYKQQIRTLRKEKATISLISKGHYEALLIEQQRNRDLQEERTQ